MTIELNENVEEHLLEVKASGKLSAEDYHDFEPAVERLIDAGKIKILFEMHDFHGWEMGARGKTSNSLPSTAVTSKKSRWSEKRIGRNGWR